MTLRAPVLQHPDDGTTFSYETTQTLWAQNLGETDSTTIANFSNYDLSIYYDSLTGDNHIDCWCSRWDVDNYSVIIETWLKKSDMQTLLNNTVPGAVGELYKILGKPTYYDQTWEGNNTLRLVPNSNSASTLYKMRRETLIYPKNITTSPLNGDSEWLNIKIEGYISGSGHL